jgi:Tfp pilus assembly protein PilE
MEAGVKKQRGFTTVELAAVLLTLCVIAGVVGTIFAAVHFISKFW